MTTLTFQFPTGNLAFNKPDMIMTRIKRISNLALEIIASHFQFYLKFEFDITLIDIDTALLVTKTISFPDHVLSIKNKDFTQIFEGLNSLFNHLENAPLQEDTKKKLHEVSAMKLKIAKRNFGGCINYKTPIYLQNKRCVLQPANKDNLCFWRCLAIALYRDTIPNIDKQTSKIQKEKAIELKNQYYNEYPDLLSVDTVNIDQLPSIANIFNINIQLYTLDTVNKQLQAILIKCENSENIKQVLLYYDEKQNHFVLINTLVGYGDILKCPQCKQVFD